MSIPTHIDSLVLITGGVGGARFTRGLLRLLERERRTDISVTCIVNTGDDMWLNGLRICPDLDTMMYTLGGGVNEEQGWGRADETTTVSTEITRYDATGTWFTLGDRDLATHIVRTARLRDGAPLSAVTAQLSERWQLPVTLLPMSDAEVETHVVVRDDGVERRLHFEQWWVKYHASLPAIRFEQQGVDRALPAPGVLETLDTADLILLPPSNPIVSVGTVLGVPGIVPAIHEARAPVVGVSPIIGGAAVRGMADACLSAVGVATTAEAVASHYHRTYDLLDGWLVDEVDAGCVPAIERLGVACRAVPLWMTDVDASAGIAAAAIALAHDRCGFPGR